MSRLAPDIAEQQHPTLHRMAAAQGKTIGQYAVERLVPAERTRRLLCGS